MINKQTSEAIDSLRVIFCGVVVVSHIYEFITGDFNNHINEALSYYAVVGFFFLSGYVNAHSYDKKRNYVDFIKSRFWRIYPKYFFAVCISFLIAVAFGVSNFQSDILNFVFLQSNFVATISTNLPLWSLTFEIFLYLIFPIMFYLFRIDDDVKTHLLNFPIRTILFIVGVFLFYRYPALFVAFGAGIALKNIPFPKFNFFPEIGKQTYEIYIFHYPVLFVLFNIW